MDNAVEIKTVEGKPSEKTATLKAEVKVGRAGARQFKVGDQTFKMTELIKLIEQKTNHVIKNGTKEELKDFQDNFSPALTKAIRLDHEGEAKYKEQAGKIQQLLRALTSKIGQLFYNREQKYDELRKVDAKTEIDNILDNFKERVDKAASKSVEVPKEVKPEVKGTPIVKEENAKPKVKEEKTTGLIKGDLLKKGGEARGVLGSQRHKEPKPISSQDEIGLNEWAASKTKEKQIEDSK